MHKLLLLVTVFCSPLPGITQHYSPIKNPDTFKAAFQQASAGISSLRSEFTQEKQLSLLSETLRSTGVFYFKKENKVRLEYQQPFQYLMIIQGAQMVIKDEQHTSKIDVQSSRMLQQVNRIMLDCVQGTVFSNPDFRVTIFESPEDYKLQMIPQTKGLKDFFDSIDIYISREDFSVKRIQMNETGGDYTLISFKNKQLNETLPDELFAVQ
ncbi:MAG: hypothetical protein KatS3mg031_0299 [Chitinophagales bacterium]|nr:MAG: hypothetical protein KatS3mg031_0299 [Chitinophagales bacterium]